MIIDVKASIFILLLFTSLSLLFGASQKEADLSNSQIIQLQKKELYQMTDVQSEEVSVIKLILISRLKALKERNDKLEAELKQKNENSNMTTDEKYLLIRKLQVQLDSTRTALTQANSKLVEFTELLNNRSIGISNPESQENFAQFIQGTSVTKYAESVLFSPGSATLNNSAKQVLKEFSKHLSGMGNSYVIQVIGNTDNVPIRGELMKKYPTNWELSVARSVAVVKYIVEELKIKPKNIIVGGKSEYNPVVPNSTTKNRSENRRVDLLLSH